MGMPSWEAPAIATIAAPVINPNSRSASNLDRGLKPFSFYLHHTGVAGF